MNELLFLFQIICITFCALFALWLGKEALISFIAILCILANFFVIKQITLFGLNATASDAVSVGAVLGLNLLQEYFGKPWAKRALWISFAGALLYTLMSQFHLLYIPNSFDGAHHHYHVILSSLPRIIIASFSTYLFVQYLDVQLYGFLKTYFEARFYLLRNYTSLIICQLLDTVLFSFLGLYGIVEHIGQIILISFTIKLITILIATPFVGLSKKIIKQEKERYEQLSV